LNARARRPDLTLLLDLPAEVAAARRAADGRPEEMYDRIETQRRVAQNYRDVCTKLAASERIVVLDGTRSLDDLAAEILRLTLQIAQHS
jgi:dTMP kinase